MNLRTFLTQLRRRNVYKVAIAYEDARMISEAFKLRTYD